MTYLNHYKKILYYFLKKKESSLSRLDIPKPIYPLLLFYSCIFHTIN